MNLHMVFEVWHNFGLLKFSMIITDELLRNINILCAGKESRNLLLLAFLNNHLQVVY